VSEDSNGATESQTSADGATYGGTLDDGKTISKATNVFAMVSSRKWTVHARGAARSLIAYSSTTRRPCAHVQGDRTPQDVRKLTKTRR
jgi:hypothetical protein